MRFLLALLLSCLASLGCIKGAAPPSPPSAAEPTRVQAAPGPAPTDAARGVAVVDEERRCSTDADCTLTTEDCCGCQALGKQVGVRADQVAAIAQRRAPICSAIACAQAMSDDPSCTAVHAVCRSGLCVPAVGTTTPTPVEPIR